jgi:hypothetical protein
MIPNINPEINDALIDRPVKPSCISVISPNPRRSNIWKQVSSIPSIPNVKKPSVFDALSTMIPRSTAARAITFVLYIFSR